MNFRVLDFRPIDDEPFISMQTLQWFELGTRPGHLVQWKAWRQRRERVAKRNLRTSVTTRPTSS